MSNLSSENDLQALIRMVCSYLLLFNIPQIAQYINNIPQSAQWKNIGSIIPILYCMMYVLHTVGIRIWVLYGLEFVISLAGARDCIASDNWVQHYLTKAKGTSQAALSLWSKFPGFQPFAHSIQPYWLSKVLAVRKEEDALWSLMTIK